MKHNYLIKMLNSHVYDVAIISPLEKAQRLSTKLGVGIWLKREDQQPVFSFKLRGAYNKMAQLARSELARGVITASAGNHAQGVALSAKKLSSHAIIVMPVTTPQVKISAVQNFGGDHVDIQLQGESYSDAYEFAEKTSEERGLTFIHPFDDPDVIAGQGTIGLEILQQSSDTIHAIFVAIGGGGLASGVAIAVKTLRPEVKVIGVQTIDSDAMSQSLKLGRRVALTDVGLFSDGTAVKLVGETTFNLCQQYLDGVILVDADEVCAAIKDVFEDTRSVVEPAGALALAGLKKYLETHPAEAKQNFVAITSGANMNFDRLRFVAERADMGQAKEALFAVTLPEKRGSFRRFCELIGGNNITEFNYRMSDPQEAHIFVGIGVTNRGRIDELKELLDLNGFPAINLSHDELAKTHLRHLVGGHFPQSIATMNEVLYRFEFPERPGALMRFLEKMPPNWNVSLFHYRNQGGDAGRIVVGLQVPEADRIDFMAFLNGLGYRFWDETLNPAYQLFLAANPFH